MRGWWCWVETSCQVAAKEAGASPMDFSTDWVQLTLGLSADTARVLMDLMLSSHRRITLHFCFLKPQRLIQRYFLQFAGVPRTCKKILCGKCNTQLVTPGISTLHFPNESMFCTLWVLQQKSSSMCWDNMRGGVFVTDYGKILNRTQAGVEGA